MDDYFLEVGLPGSATTLAAPGYTIGNTGITVASTTNWPGTGKGVAFAIDTVDSSGVRVEGTYCEFVGTVSSATSITDVDLTFGDPQNYAAGSTTRVYIPVTSTRENRIVAGWEVQHNQDGTHANVITTNAINENTPANGVTIDGVLLKDNKIQTNAAVPPSALATGAAAANVTTTETTASTTFVGLTTAQALSVTIGANGLLQVSIGATLSNNGANASYVSFALSGGNTLASSDSKAIINVGTNAASFGRTFLLTGLTPGATTVTMQFRVSGGTGTFSSREISAIPL